MERRTFMAMLTGGLVAAPLAAEAQPAAKVARIGFLALNVAPNPHLREAFLQGLRDLGYVEGHNVVIEYRDAEGKSERLPALAAELVALKVDVILAGGTSHALAAKPGPDRIAVERPTGRSKCVAPARRPNVLTSFCGSVRMHRIR